MGNVFPTKHLLVRRNQHCWKGSSKCMYVHWHNCANIWQISQLVSHVSNGSPSWITTEWCEQWPLERPGCQTKVHRRAGIPFRGILSRPPQLDLPLSCQTHQINNQARCIHTGSEAKVYEVIKTILIIITSCIPDRHLRKVTTKLTCLFIEYSILNQ